jgi:uncharacterized protein YjbI with pentapeptide repeats
VKTIGPAQFAELLAQSDARSADRVLTVVDTQLEGIVLADKELSSCVLVRCRIVGAVFEHCDLSFAQLFDSRFENCRMIGCKLRKAELNGANLQGVDFTGSEMSRCDLTRADLRGANLTGCVLDWAWLIQCDLRDAILENASFRGARIGEAKLYNSRRFTMGPHDGARVDNVDLSPAGDGTVIVHGDELWEKLSAGAV